MSVMTKEEKRQLFLAVKEAWPEISFAEKGVTRTTRANAWQKVFDDCRAKGHGWANGRDAGRDGFPATSGRKSSRSKTGSGGDTKVSDLDEQVLDIIGRDSAGVKGLQVPVPVPVRRRHRRRAVVPRELACSSPSPSTTQPTQYSDGVMNFVPKSQGPSTPLAQLGAMPGGLFKLPRKKRPLQSANSQSFDDEEADEEFKRKKLQWLDGMLQLNEQKRYINELKIQKLHKEWPNRRRAILPPTVAKLMTTSPKRVRLTHDGEAALARKVVPRPKYNKLGEDVRLFKPKRRLSNGPASRALGAYYNRASATDEEIKCLFRPFGSIRDFRREAENLTEFIVYVKRGEAMKAKRNLEHTKPDIVLRASNGSGAILKKAWTGLKIDCIEVETAQPAGTPSLFSFFKPI